MKEADKIEVIIGILSDSDRYEMAEELMQIYDKLIRENYNYYKRVDGCRDYLMQVEPADITVENCLVALGYNKNGLDP